MDITLQNAINRALNEIERCQENKGNGFMVKESEQALDELNATLKALRKQEQKKPRVIKLPCGIDDYHCPECGRNIISRDKDGEWLAGQANNYCPDCGQALKWDE